MRSGTLPGCRKRAGCHERAAPDRQQRPWSRSRPRSRTADWLRRHGIDPMLFPAADALLIRSRTSPSSWQSTTCSIGSTRSFPEVSANGEWDAREHLFSNAVSHAEAILVDSEVGREDRPRVLRQPHHARSGPGSSLSWFRRIWNAPSRRPWSTRTRIAWRLTGGICCFPAQFWPHKNHRRVVEALVAAPSDGYDVRSS